MEHLKLLLFAFLVTVCSFYVESVPVYNKYAPKKSNDKSPQMSSKGYFGYLSSNPGTGSPLGSKVSSGGSDKVVTAFKSRASIGRTPQHLSKGYFAYFNGSSAAVSPQVSNAPKKESGKLASGARRVKIGQKLAVGLVGTGAVLHMYISVVCGIAGGPGLLGTVGNGIASGVGGIMSGISDLGTGSINHLANALSAVTPDSLSKALNLGELSQNIADKVNVTNILSNVISGQANPLNGVMNLETASVVLDKFGGLVPGLGPSVKAVKTVSQVMKKIKAIQNENGQVDPKKLMVEAADLYFSDVDPNFKKKLIDLAPAVGKAATGDTAAAMQIASSLADPNTVLEAMKGVGYKSQIELVQNVVKQASDYAGMVQNAANAAQSLKGMIG